MSIYTCIGAFNIYDDRAFGQEKLLDHIVTNADSNIIESPLDNVKREQGQFSSERRLSNTLDSIRQNISQYLNWIVFLGLTGATILIIYNAMLLVFTPVLGDQLDKVKKRMINLLIGVVVMTGFYFIIKVSLSVINLVLE